MPQLIIYPIEHRQEKRIALKYDYIPNSRLDIITRQLPGRKYSVTKKLWHIPWRDDYHSWVKEVFEPVDDINLIFEIRM
jgi:hypothetical protein